MLITTSLIASVFVTVVGLLIIWSNPVRTVNRAVFFCSCHIAVWLALHHIAVGAREGLFWFRLICAVSAWIPLQFALVKEAISHGPAMRWTATFARNWLMVVICAALSIDCLTSWFVPAHSTGLKKVYGPGYYVYYVGIFGLYAFLLQDTLRKIRTLAGSSRLELQVWLGGGCAMATTVLGMMALAALTHNILFLRMQSLVVLGFYAVTVFAITTYRIFDARQLLLVALEKTLLVTLTAIVAFAVDWGLASVLPSPADFLVTTAIVIWFAVTLNHRLDRMFMFFPQATAARQATLDAARLETRLDKLEDAFVKVLKGWGQSDCAIIAHGTKELLRGTDIELPGNGVVMRTMRQLRWATPERLARERPTAERAEVAKFLQERQLGALVLGEGPTLAALMGVGVPASRWPFTYPQVTQLMELASIMESALERAHYAVKVQHTEQLATVGLLGASLAHEIRNPLVTIKTFVQLLPQHHQDAAFREKFFRLIGDEVGRIDRLTEQLLDLASPRAYVASDIALHPVLRASIDLVAAKVADKNITLLTEFQAAPDRVHTDASAAKQVMLNLCFNAIQAVESHAGERWIKVSTRNVATGIEMAVADSGPGIAPEIRPRLFQPFQTTKSSGFGLGLAICSDILANLNATISVDPAGTGSGATFRVIFPCQPQSS